MSQARTSTAEHRRGGKGTTVPGRREPLPPEMHLSRRHRVRLVGEGVLVGIAGGLVISSYRFMLSHGEAALRTCTTWLGTRGPLVLVWFVALALLCLVVGRLMLFEPYTQASGIPQTKAEVAGRLDMPFRRVLPVKFCEGVLCALSGLSLGREGPSVMLGGMSGKAVSRALHAGRNHERILVTCGAAAGMSAAFHAPLTGVLFALEEIHKSFSAILIISVMTSSVVADFVSSQLLGVTPLIHFVAFSSLPHGLYLAVILMGVLCGFAGFLHNNGMFFVQDRLFGPLEKYTPYVRLAIPFMLAGIVAFLAPDLLCGGDAILERVMHVKGESALLLTALLVGKFAFTAICFGSGAPGGTLFPLVVMGSLLGALYGLATNALVGVSGLYENSFIVLGIAGLFSAVIQAPVTAVVLVFELTGSLDALLATSVVSIVSYVTATLLGCEPYYEHLYDRMLGHSNHEDQPYVPKTHKVMYSYVIGTGSAAEGHVVSEIPWPQDCLVVTVRHEGANVTPKGNTPLNALDEITVVMDEASQEDHNAFIQRLCASRD